MHLRVGRSHSREDGESDDLGEHDPCRELAGNVGGLHEPCFISKISTSSGPLDRLQKSHGSDSGRYQQSPDALQHMRGEINGPLRASIPRDQLRNGELVFSECQVLGQAKVDLELSAINRVAAVRL